jgi:hypothetical protein
MLVRWTSGLLLAIGSLCFFACEPPPRAADDSEEAKGATDQEFWNDFNADSAQGGWQHWKVRLTNWDSRQVAAELALLNGVDAAYDPIHRTQDPSFKWRCDRAGLSAELEDLSPELRDDLSVAYRSQQDAPHGNGHCSFEFYTRQENVTLTGVPYQEYEGKTLTAWVSLPIVTNVTKKSLVLANPKGIPSDQLQLIKTIMTRSAGNQLLAVLDDWVPNPKDANDPLRSVRFAILPPVKRKPFNYGGSITVDPEASVWLVKETHQHKMPTSTETVDTLMTTSKKTEFGGLQVAGYKLTLQGEARDGLIDLVRDYDTSAYYDALNGAWTQVFSLSPGCLNGTRWAERAQKGMTWAANDYLLEAAPLPILQHEIEDGECYLFFDSAYLNANDGTRNALTVEDRADGTTKLTFVTGRMRLYARGDGSPFEVPAPIAPRRSRAGVAPELMHSTRWPDDGATLANAFLQSDDADWVGQRPIANINASFASGALKVYGGYDLGYMAVEAVFPKAADAQ